ncbi:hypothetical protein L7F22_006508 [Adiantum nelumboides]|nr:hypothetical protein [Adiantum nelumboides]
MVAARINFQQGAKRNLKPMEAKEKQEYKGKNFSQNSSKGNSKNNKAKEKGVFKDDIPGELPPKRGDDDHMIELIPRSSPPNKPPYRVSQAQQEEIMRMDGYKEEGSSSQDRQSNPIVHEVGEGSSQAEEGFPHAAFSITGTASPGTLFGGMQSMVPNPMYANIGLHPGFQGTQGQFGVSKGNLGMAGFSIPPVNMTSRHQHVTGQGVHMAHTGVLRTVQAKGVQGLNEAGKHKYVPPMGAAFGLNSTSIVQQLSLYDVLPNASTPFGPGPYRFAQARVVEDHTMSQVVLQGMADGGSVGILLVVVGATHVLFGSKGTGVPARISKNLKKRTQAVILLNPERQRIRKEGELPEADFLWYSAAKECSRNCFDRAEIARVMDAAGRRRDALPKDLQAGLDLGLIPPELLKDFFDLDKQPFIAELTKHFQGFRERWLADPRFLQRLGIEEAISITTTLIAQYVRRKGRFFQELDYVLTDTIRGAVVDFFTVWLPAPTLSFRSADTQSHASGILEGLTGLLGSLPDNAFQRSTATAKWDLQARVLGVVVSGMKLFSVGFIASIGTVAFTNSVLGIKQRLNPQKLQKRQNKRSPIIKTAFVYACFLGTSANLRYQAIAGLVEHWIADFYLASYPLAGNALSFVARTANSYWGTQQWVDLARITGLQAHKDTPPAVTEKSMKEIISETAEHLPLVSDKSADCYKADSAPWDIPVRDHKVQTTTRDEDKDNMENINGPRS